DIGLEQRDADLAQRLGDVALGERAAARQALEHRAEARGQAVEHENLVPKKNCASTRLARTAGAPGGPKAALSLVPAALSVKRAWAAGPANAGKMQVRAPDLKASGSIGARPSPPVSSDRGRRATRLRDYRADRRQPAGGGARSMTSVDSTSSGSPV